MIEPAVRDELLHAVEELPPPQQRQVLDFARRLRSAAPVGVRGSELLRFARTIPADSAREMTEAIEAGCEQVDSREW